MMVCKRTRPIVTRFTKLKPFQSCSKSQILVVLSTRRPIGLAFSDSHLLHIFKCNSSFHISILCGFCRNKINWSEAEYLNEGPSGIKSSSISSTPKVLLHCWIWLPSPGPTNYRPVWAFCYLTSSIAKIRKPLITEVQMVEDFASLSFAVFPSFSSVWLYCKRPRPWLMSLFLFILSIVHFQPKMFCTFCPIRNTEFQHWNNFLANFFCSTHIL